MRVILEGVDGAGKTTLARILADKYGLDICHCTQNDPADYEFYKNTARKDNIVWDRHTLGELVYSYIFKRPQKIGIEDARLVLAYAREAGAKIFVLTAEDHILEQRLRSREKPEDPRILQNVDWIDNRFKFYAELYGIPVIDTSKMTLGEIFTLMEKEEKPYKFIH